MTEPGPVRVLVVDDDEDIRALLRTLFVLDDRFQVVAEAADGLAALDAVANGPVDLVVLDCDMPVMDGLTALPLLRERSPDAAVVIYTARADTISRQAVIAAGAVDVVDKLHLGARIVERLADTLVAHWSADDADVEISVGPVAGDAATLWVENSSRIVEAVVANPSVLPDPLRDDEIQTFRDLLALWQQIASSEPVFYWRARAKVADVDRMVRAWAAVDALSDEQLALLGCTWSPPEARPFFEALTTAVVSALGRHEETRQLAARLREGWPVHD